MISITPNSFLPSFMAGDIILSAYNTYSVTLLNNTSAISDTVAEASWSSLSDISAYITSGAPVKTLPNPRLISDLSDIAYTLFTGDSVVWTSGTFSTDAAVISDVNGKIIVIERYEEQVLVSDTLTLNFNALNGILRINNNELSLNQHSHAMTDIVGLTSALGNLTTAVDSKADINHTIQSHYGLSTSADPANGQVLAWNAVTSAWWYVSPALSCATYHNTLLGLDSDDHAQYLTSGRADLLYSQLDHTHTSGMIIGLTDQIDSITCAISTKEPIISEGTSSQWYRGDKTWQSLDKTIVGLSEVDNTSDINKPVSSATQVALNTKQDVISSASSSAFYAGDHNFKSVDYSMLTGVPSEFVPSAHVHGQSDISSVSGWITSGLNSKEPVLVQGTSAQYYRGDKTWQTLDKTSVGLGSVDNTSDLNKPVSNATTSAIASAVSSKENTVSPGTSGQYYRGDKTWQTLDKASVGLNNVDNTSDLNKPLSNATTAALSGKENVISSGTAAQYYRGDKTWQALSYNILSDIPSSFVPSAHVHVQADVTSSSGWITSALNNKENAVSSGTSAQYYRGDKTWQALNTKSLSDVSSATPTDGQALVYSSAVGKYVPGSVSTSGTGSSDHHTLTNLTTYDDHPQYLTSGRGDARYLTSASSIAQSQVTSSSGWITSATTLTETVVSSVSAGAITAGTTLAAGMSFTTFIKNLLLQTFYPSFVAPSAGLASSLASSVESGTTGNVTLTVTLNRGQILGKNNTSGVWVPATQQDYRAGAATKYVINGTDNGTTASLVVNSYQVVDNSNTWSSTTSYAAGPQPYDSLGANYSSALTSGSIVASVTVTGKRKAFYGTDSSSSTPYTLSSQIRAISNSLLGPVNGSTFTINIPSGAKMVTFAYPNTLQAVSSVKYVEGLNAEVKGIFTLTNINVEGASGYSATSYKIYTYVPASPFSSTATYNVTI